MRKRDQHSKASEIVRKIRCQPVGVQRNQSRPRTSALGEPRASFSCYRRQKTARGAFRLPEHRQRSSGAPSKNLEMTEDNTRRTFRTSSLIRRTSQGGAKPARLHFNRRSSLDPEPGPGPGHGVSSAPREPESSWLSPKRLFFFWFVLILSPTSTI